MQKYSEIEILKTICFIGARGGSKRVPKKNIRLLNKKPSFIDSPKILNGLSIITLRSLLSQ